MNKKISLKWVLIPGITLIIGFALLSFGIISTINFFSAPKQELVSGEQITIDKSGRYDIYYEYRYAFNLTQDINFHFTNTDGQEVQSRSTRFNSTYNINGVTGDLIGIVDLQQGTYTVQISEIPNNDNTMFVIIHASFVQNIVMGILGIVFGGLLIFFSVIGIVIILVLRHMGKNKTNKLQHTI